MNTTIESLTQALRRFAAERDWEQFHSPKNLAAALTVEAAELLEHFQWLTEEQSRNLPADKRAAVSHEIADVLLYLLQIADKLQIDVVAAANAMGFRPLRRFLTVDFPLAVRPTRALVSPGSML